MNGSNKDSQVCAGCGESLSSFPQRREGVCSKLQCRGPYLSRIGEEHRKQEQTKRDELRDNATVIANEYCGRSDESVLVVPAFEENLESLNEERRVRFETNLREALAFAAEIAADSSNHDALNMEFEYRHLQHEASLTVINACTSCRGACCLNGRDHAFLQKSFLAWRLLNEPTVSPEDLFADYTARIPERSHANSCVYHAEFGCVLPREIRGSTCNDFLCTGIVDHASVQDDPSAPTIAVAMDVGNPVRAGKMNIQGERVEFDFPTIKGAGNE